MCYEQGDLLLGDQDILLGEIGGSPFYMHKNQFDYWKHTQLIIDVVDGRGGMFSLEGVEGADGERNDSRAAQADATKVLGSAEC